MTELPSIEVVRKHDNPSRFAAAEDHFVTVKLTFADGKPPIQTPWHRSKLDFELFRRKLPAELLAEFDQVTEEDRQRAYEDGATDERMSVL